MDVLTGEDVHHFLQHVFQEIICGHTSRTEICLFIRNVRTGQFGIGRKNLLGMGGHLYFRNNRNSTLLGITYQAAQLILCIITAISTRGSFLCIMSLAVIPPCLPQRIRSPCRKACQSGIALYLHTPTRSISQVKMQTVHFI